METVEKGLSRQLTKELLTKELLQTACIPIPTPTGRQRGSGVEGQSGREREVGWCGLTRSAAIPTPKPTPTSAFSSAARAARTSTPTSSSIRAPAASPPSSAGFRMLRARTLPATFDLNSPEAMVPFVKAAGLEQYEYGRLLNDEEVTIGLLASIGSRELEVGVLAASPLCVGWSRVALGSSRPSLWGLPWESAALSLHTPRHWPRKKPITASPLAAWQRSLH